VPETVRLESLHPEADLLFSTARVTMTAEIADRIRLAVDREVNWIRLIQLAMQHETMALLYWNLRRICPEKVPAGILAALAARSNSQAVEASRRAEELARIMKSLEAHGILAVAYKGLALAQRLYGSLSLREFSEFSDLDILIHEGDLLKAHDVLQTEGYGLAFLKRSEVSEYARTHRELHFCRENGDKRLLELHWRFMVRSARVQDDPERFLRRREMVALAGAVVPSLPLEVYFLVLSLHATKHKWRKLKLICDIAEILLSPDLDWDYVTSEAEDLGLQRILAVGVLLAEDPLGVRSPARLTERLKIDRTARALAAECRQELLQEPDETWRDEAEYKFLFEIRERMQDKASMFLYDQLLPRITPDERDRKLVSIPDSLSALYYLVRPVRMAWEKITE
jgi:Uncharacterised nucleotidyltransferase